MNDKGNEATFLLIDVLYFAISSDNKVQYNTMSTHRAVPINSYIF